MYEVKAYSLTSILKNELIDDTAYTEAANAMIY